jgi:hypothetical protein
MANSFSLEILKAFRITSKASDARRQERRLTYGVAAWEGDRNNMADDVLMVHRSRI